MAPSPGCLRRHLLRLHDHAEGWRDRDSTDARSDDQPTHIHFTWADPPNPQPLPASATPVMDAKAEGGGAEPEATRYVLQWQNEGGGDTYPAGSVRPRR